MTFRFRKRIKLMPGVHLNIGKKGISTSIGVRGASVTIGKKTRVNVGIPGSGLSHSSVIASPAAQALTAKASSPTPLARRDPSFGPVATFFVVFIPLQVLGVLPLALLIANEAMRGIGLWLWSVLVFLVSWRTAAATARRLRAHR